MKKILLCSTIILFGFISTSYAALCGFYFGGGLGYGRLGTPANNVFDFPTATYERGGLAGRIFAGYNITQNFGIEGGAARYARSRYSASLGAAVSTIKYYGEAADIVAKIYVPIVTNRFNVYVLAGAASFWEQIYFNDAGFPFINTYAPPDEGKTTQRRGRPIYGGGLIFNANRYLDIHVEYTQIYQLGNFRTNPLAVPYGALWTGNFAVHFC